jgi:hypothetical protein
LRLELGTIRPALDAESPGMSWSFLAYLPVAAVAVAIVGTAILLVVARVRSWAARDTQTGSNRTYSPR